MRTRKLRGSWKILVFLVVLVLLVVLLIKSVDNKDAVKVAVVNGEKISMKDLNERFEQLPLNYQEILSKEDFLVQMIEERLLLQKAAESGVAVTDGEVELEIDGTLVQLKLNKDDLLKKLEEQAQSYEEFKLAVGNQLIVTKYLEKVLPKIELSDEEARSYYEDNEDIFSTPEQVRASHILISNADREDELAFAVAAALLKGKELENWTAAVVEYSEDPGTAERGGDLGFFSRGMMVKEFEDAAFSGEIGDIIGPVKTEFGYHLILIIDKVKRVKTSYSKELGEQIKSALKQQQNQANLLLYLEELKMDADIEIFLEESEAQ